MMQHDKTEPVPGLREQELETIFNTSIDVMFLVSVEPGRRFRFTSVNQAFLSTTGLQREQVEGKFVDEVIPPVSYQVVAAKYLESIQLQQTVQWEETTPYPAGVKTGIVSITPVFDPDGSCSKLVGTVHDITHRKKIEEENERNRHLLNERVKELTTLYKVSQLLHNESLDNGELVQSIVNIIPAGWQYPEKAASRIQFHNKKFSSENFRDSSSKQVALFDLPDGSKGAIEVVYPEEMMKGQPGLFLPEEQDLLTMLADMLRLHFSRKRSAEQLLKQTRLSESIINSLPGIFYLFDAFGNYLLWNRNLELISGYNGEEIKKMYPLDFFEEPDKTLIRKRIEQVFTDGYTEVEAELKAKDGKKTPYYFNGIAINYDDKACLVGVGIDISELKGMEAELREAENKFRTLVEKSQVGVYIIQNGRFTYVNPRFAEIFGYSQEEVQHFLPINRLLTEEYLTVAQQHIEARMKGEVDAVHYEADGIRKDGSVNRVEFFGSRTIYQGKAAIIGTMVDITERRIAEEALQKSQANINTIFETTDTIYALLDTNLQVISFNQKAKEFVRNEFHQELKPGTNMLSYFGEGRREEIHERMKKVLSGEMVHYELSYPQADGSTHWYYLRMLPIRNKGAVFGSMVAVSDITEKKLLEQEIMDQKVQEQKKMTRAVLNAQEKERNKIGQELHDNVNQILVGAKMYLGFAANKPASQKELITQSMDLLDKAINEIRSLTREQVTPQRQVDLYELVQILVADMMSHSSLQIDFVYDVGDYAIRDDLKINIYRIIQEGMNNILKHAAAKKVTLLVKAGADGLHVVIADDGKGFTASLANSKGVGITNILNRVESYNGRVFIESKPGPGCKIDIMVPL